LQSHFLQRSTRGLPESRPTMLKIRIPIRQEEQ
jgi:hypothetical protein